MLNTSTIYGRIKDITPFSTFEELSTLLNADSQNVRSWKSRNKIPYEELLDYCMRNGVSFNWLLTGVGSKFSELYKLSEHDNSIKIEMHGYKCIPFFNNLIDSIKDIAIEDQEFITVPTHILPFSSSNTQAVKCETDSMSPSINDGNIIFIDIGDNTSVQDGNIYIMKCTDTIFIKRLFKSPDGGIIAKSDNALYPEFKLKNHECKILGQVKYKIEKV